MPKKGHSEEQILRVLHQAESGTTVREICREYGISDATFYIWKKKPRARLRCARLGRQNKRRPAPCIAARPRIQNSYSFSSRSPRM